MFSYPIVIASHNEGKVSEIRDLLTPLGVTVISAKSLNLPEPEENGLNFVENAKIKSEQAAKLSGNIALADDSGLCVPALDNAPGIYSARWAGEKKDFLQAAKRIEVELIEKGEEFVGQPAYFICVLALTYPNGVTETFEGKVDGRLSYPRGNKGFGYDSIFVPEGYDITFGEMEADEKHSISHRAEAFAKFMEKLRNQ